MPRIARVVVPNMPHHVTQRGNRRQRTFFEEDDYDHYKRLMAKWCSRHDVAVWAYCLMPNHVHLILTPADPGGLAKAVGEAHRRYTLAVNEREQWTGCLWQGRFFSFPMDVEHLVRAARYVLLNPVRARLVCSAADWPHSSLGAHIAGRGDGLVDTTPLSRVIQDWDGFLGHELTDGEAEEMRRHQRTGRPMGSTDFVRRLEVELKRPLLPGRVGRKPKKIKGHNTHFCPRAAK